MITSTDHPTGGSGVPLSSKLRLLLAFLCGAVSVLGFAPFDWWPVVLPCVAYLFVLLHAADSTRQGFVTGYVFGLGLFGAGVYWVYYSLHLFGAAIAPLAAIGTLLFVMVLALYTCLLYTSPSPRDGLLSRMPSSA